LASLVHLFPDQASRQAACPREGRVPYLPDRAGGTIVGNSGAGHGRGTAAGAVVGA